MWPRWRRLHSALEPLLAGCTSCRPRCNYPLPTAHLPSLAFAKEFATAWFQTSALHNGIFYFPRSGAPHGIRSGRGIVSYPASHGAQAGYETMAATFAYILLTQGKHDAQPWGGPLEILGGLPCPAAPFRELYLTHSHAR